MLLLGKLIRTGSEEMGMEVIKLKDSKVVILDQTLLPTEVRYIECSEVEAIAEAIESLRIRGAPALGVAGAFALAMVALKDPGAPKALLLQRLREARERIARTRPTAVNLSWAMDRVLRRAEAAGTAEAVVKEALWIYEENKEADRKMGEHGLGVIDDGDTILTHCNAGALATAGYGSALGVIKASWKAGKGIKVVVGETRPLLQGARLSAFELVYDEIPVTVITDSMAAFAMQRLGIKKVVVGADRIAANGDTANKIGTYSIAILAKAHGIPFYIAAPTSTIDPRMKSGDEIPIEFRDKDEIVFFAGKRMVPDGAEVFNPAFDVTPAEYITGIITERGVLRPPYRESIAALFP